MSICKTVKCPICGKPYVFMPFYAGDQSACPACVREAEKNTFGKPRIPSWDGPGSWDR